MILEYYKKYFSSLDKLNKLSSECKYNIILEFAKYNIENFDFIIYRKKANSIFYSYMILLLFSYKIDLYNYINKNIKDFEAINFDITIFNKYKKEFENCN